MSPIVPAGSVATVYPFNLTTLVDTIVATVNNVITFNVVATIFSAPKVFVTLSQIKFSSQPKAQALLNCTSVSDHHGIGTPPQVVTDTIHFLSCSVLNLESISSLS